MKAALRGALILLPLSLAGATAAVEAQVRPPVQDSVAAPDSMPQPSPADSAAADTVPARPLVNMPAMPLAPGVGFAGGEWIWDRQALLREGATSLYDLLERIPSVAALRAGSFGQPETAAAFGLTAGRVEVVLDGYVLDPLAASTFDFAEIPLAELREVRVERRIGLLRIRLLSESPHVNEPHTRVEAGIGEPTGNLFRGQFLMPYVIFGPLGLAIERIESAGVTGNEPADAFSGWAKWAWTDGTRGVQAEYLRTTLQREPDSPWLVDRVRQDLIVRARNALPGGFFAELFAGRSETEERLPEEAQDSVRKLRFERVVHQAGARAAWQSQWAVLGGTFRYRDADYLPRTEAVLDADVAIGPLRFTGEFGTAAWDSVTTSYTHAHAEVGPLLGASAFAEITRGERGAPLYRDSTFGVIVSEREGQRLGLSLQLGQRAAGSIAFVSLEQPFSRPFGLPFDSAGTPVQTGNATGIEAYGRLVLWPSWLAVESWITDWSKAAGWLYTPTRSWRTALTAHAVPLESGNLEILGRVEGWQRGSMLAYDPEADEAGEGDEGDEGDLLVVDGHTVFSAYLQIRVIDVRAFIRYEDFLNADPELLPGQFLNGPRIFYGVKWVLRN